MAVPKFSAFFGVVLEILSDGKIYTAKELQGAITRKMRLSEDDLAEQVPSGQSTFINRISWAGTYLNQAGLIRKPARGQYQITDVGVSATRSGEIINVDYLLKFPSFRQFRIETSVNKKEKTITPTGKEDEEKSPSEVLSDAYRKMNDTLAGELLAEVMKLTPADFERLVVKLLLKMGYGSGIDDAGNVTKLAGDGGIDGFIKEDQLGFSYIYIQAKQWDPNRTVSRPELQTFAGALQGARAMKGLFITTARFSDGATSYAANLPNTSIVLIDGHTLMAMMIKYNLGVSIQQTYEVKRIDADFFIDGLDHL